jgi:ketosteroid isomerase-like protein
LTIGRKSIVTIGRTLPVAVTAIASLIACTPGGRSTATTQEDMIAVSRMLVTLDRLAADGDLESLLSYLSDDAVFMLPDEAALVGRRQIGIWYRALFDEYQVETAHEPLETDAFGDMIVHRGNLRRVLRPKSGTAPTTFDEKYLFVIRKQPDGSLRIWRAAFNSNPTGGE